ncbi:hypothetical protein M501DRAFT_725045 [Patellaria atrata CBS 101060]|uniref:Uncharacterized protein n=1 Tax=Patellaria atrata CBS 101060 TaxID=1346257 RepID=A0A9P4SDA2_9PEZI|nr:hypothetical protein M501DRAFT_725045 [Patellaria atrata CBS 101060]
MSENPTHNPSASQARQDSTITVDGPLKSEAPSQPADPSAPNEPALATSDPGDATPRGRREPDTSVEGTSPSRQGPTTPDQHPARSDPPYDQDDAASRSSYETARERRSSGATILDQPRPLPPFNPPAWITEGRLPTPPSLPDRRFSRDTSPRGSRPAERTDETRSPSRSRLPVLSRSPPIDRHPSPGPPRRRSPGPPRRRLSAVQRASNDLNAIIIGHPSITPTQEQAHLNPREEFDLRMAVITMMPQNQRLREELYSAPRPLEVPEICQAPAAEPPDTHSARRVQFGGPFEGRPRASEAGPSGTQPTRPVPLGEPFDPRPGAESLNTQSFRLSPLAEPFLPRSRPPATCCETTGQYEHMRARFRAHHPNPIQLPGLETAGPSRSTATATPVTPAPTTAEPGTFTEPRTPSPDTSPYPPPPSRGTPVNVPSGDESVLDNPVRQRSQTVTTDESLLNDVERYRDIQTPPPVTPLATPSPVLFLTNSRTGELSPLPHIYFDPNDGPTQEEQMEGLIRRLTRFRLRYILESQYDVPAEPHEALTIPRSASAPPDFPRPPSHPTIAESARENNREIGEGSGIQRPPILDPEEPDPNDADVSSSGDEGDPDLPIPQGDGYGEPIASPPFHGNIGTQVEDDDAEDNESGGDPFYLETVPAALNDIELQPINAGERSPPPPYNGHVGTTIPVEKPGFWARFWRGLRNIWRGCTHGVS